MEYHTTQFKKFVGAVKAFAHRHHMEYVEERLPWCLTLQNKNDPIHTIEIKYKQGVVLVETYFNYRIKLTARNLRWINRLNATFPKIRLVIENYLIFAETYPLSDLCSASHKRLLYDLLGGLFWMVYHQKAIGKFLLGEMTEKESYDCICNATEMN